MKATKHYENGKVFVYVQNDEGAKDCMVFGNEAEMRRLGQCLVDLARIGGNSVEIIPAQRGTHRRRVRVFRGGEFVGVYNSLRECAEKLNIPASRVCEYAQNGRVYKGGYTFQYAE